MGGELLADLLLKLGDIEAHTVTLAGSATGSGRLVLLVVSPEMPAEQAERALSMASVPTASRATAVLAAATVPAARTDGASADFAGGERPGLDWRRPSAAPLWRGAGRTTGPRPGGRRDIVDDPLVRDGSPGVFTGIRGFGWRRRDHPGYTDHPTYASSS